MSGNENHRVLKKTQSDNTMISKGQTGGRKVRAGSLAPGIGGFNRAGSLAPGIGGFNRGSGGLRKGSSGAGIALFSVVEDIKLKNALENGMANEVANGR